MAKVMTHGYSKSFISTSRFVGYFPVSSVFYSKMILDNSSLAEKVALFSEHRYSQPLSLLTDQEKFDWSSTTNPFQRIIYLRKLENNWDGYGAQEFSSKHVQRALDLYSLLYNYFVSKRLNILEFGPFVAPCSDNSILFEWSGKRFTSKALEIYIPSMSEKPLTYLKSEGDFDQEGEVLDSNLNQLLNWLFEIC
jgi:hypothetical protein